MENKVVFEGIFNNYYDRLYIHALGIVKEKEDAQDIIQDVFALSGKYW